MTCEVECDSESGRACGKHTFLKVNGFPMCPKCLEEHESEDLVESIAVHCVTCEALATPGCWLLPLGDRAFPACRWCVTSPNLLELLGRIPDGMPLLKYQRASWPCVVGATVCEARCAS